MFYIGIDIGGTFTDCVLIGADGAGHVTTYRTAKALSTKGDPAEGVMTGLAELAGAVDGADAGRADVEGAGEAGRRGLDLAGLLGQTERFGHGTTIGTNAVLERTGARVGVITTAGHGDALAIMRGHGRVAG
ncbi:MAG TPA: hydantoinase/oxoprolinase N-terminal domain-containing protein, partial [Streptosporangiaceae bacterium]|nr:hydantoinase/oxoprolinase N-terminal domain-containing protein [Streptosporangiaceae bacterium]